MAMQFNMKGLAFIFLPGAISKIIILTYPNNMQSAKSVIPHVRDCWILIRLQRRSYSKPKNSWLKLRRVSQIAKVLPQQVL
jgi:hypothetical protein